MVKPTRQEPIVLQSTRGEHARALRERVLEIADLYTGDCYEGYTYSASIKYFTGHVTQHYFVSVMETIYYWLWWNQFTIVIFHLDICKEFTTNGGTPNSTLVSSNYRYQIIFFFLGKPNKIEKKKEIKKEWNAQVNKLKLYMELHALTSWFLASSDSLWYVFFNDKWKSQSSAIFSSVLSLW